MPKRGYCSVVIPSRNEGAMLHMTVENILSQPAGCDYEVIVVDDSSDDGSAQALIGRDPRVSVLRAQGLGVARARNAGAGVARGEYLVFLDAHCKVSPGWLGLFAESLRHPQVGMVGPAFTKLDEPERRGCGMRWSDYTLDLAWYEPPEEEDPYEIGLTTGACQALSAANYYRLGRYEDGFTTWGYEDVELCLRAWALGYVVLVDPRITVQHHFRESRAYEVVDADILFNWLRMIYLHFSEARIARAVAALGAYPELAQAQASLEASDTRQLRAELDAARVHDDAWFFQRFMPDMQ